MNVFTNLPPPFGVSFDPRLHCASVHAVMAGLSGWPSILAVVNASKRQRVAPTQLRRRGMLAHAIPQNLQRLLPRAPALGGLQDVARELDLFVVGEALEILFD